jgi:hypothetical protein
VSDEIQRFKALSILLRRLEMVGWLSEGVHSINLMDWDWRTEKERYNFSHMPMWVLILEIITWYREYGAFRYIVEEHTAKFSLARFFFDVAPKHDIIVISFDLSGSSFYQITRESLNGSLSVDLRKDTGAGHCSEKVHLRINYEAALKLCKKFKGFFTVFRDFKQKPIDSNGGKIISLGDTIGDYREMMAKCSPKLVREIRQAHHDLRQMKYEEYGTGQDFLLFRDNSLGQERNVHVEVEAFRILISNLIIQTFLMPPQLKNSAIAIIPGVVQIKGSKSIVSGGFLIHYEPRRHNVDLADWWTLATIWAREKATIDLFERNRRQRIGTVIHNLSNRFGSLIAKARKLRPSRKANNLAKNLEEIQSIMISATSSIRGEDKNTEYDHVKPMDGLPKLFDEVLEYLADNKDVLNRLFGRSAPQKQALTAIRKLLTIKDFPKELDEVTVRFSRKSVSLMLGELIKNALENTPWSSCEDETVEISFDVDKQGLFMKIRNPIHQDSLPRLNEIAEDLNSRRDPSGVGLGLKSMLDQCASEGLPYPTMEIDKDKYMATITHYLAKLTDN